MKSSLRAEARGNFGAASRVVALFAWLMVIVMLVFLGWVAVQRAGVQLDPSVGVGQASEVRSEVSAHQPDVALPVYSSLEQPTPVQRQTTFHTIIPDAHDPIAYYTVQDGDSISGIARQFHVKPETILYANADLLADNTNNLSVGQSLKIPPIDGVLYQWKKSDTLDRIAHRYKASSDDILTWPDNHIDIADPQIPTGALVMIPGGTRDLIMVVVPTMWRAGAGATKDVNAGCDTSKGSMIGSGNFGWPANNHTISGNDFFSGHLAIDIGAAEGAPVYASDSGVVVYSAPIAGGYGNMIMIDHGNGFTTLYAHNSQLVAQCGSNVVKGQVIAYAGSTGHSTGPHLHFEIRYRGMFVNPHDYLR